MNTYPAGNTVILTLSVVASATGAPVSPTVVTLKIKYPNGNVADISSSITEVGVGAYQASFTAGAGGVYTYQWVGTGVANIATNGQFAVTPPPLPL
jgi:hypothetical protein